MFSTMYKVLVLLLAIISCFRCANSRLLDSQDCEDGWTSNGKYCYRIRSQTHSNDQRKNWYEARDTCERLQSDLVTIETNDENEWLFKDVGSKKWHSFWIGLNDVHEENQWVWQDGSNTTFRAWKSGEPNDAGGQEDCAKMYFESSQWQDENCFALNGFICKKKQEKFRHKTLCNYDPDVCSCKIDKTTKTVRCNRDARFEYKKTPHFPVFTERLYIRDYRGLYIFNNSFAHMKNLEVLDFGDTGIFAYVGEPFRVSELPWGVFNGLAKLKELYLTNMRLDKLTAGKLQPLTSLAHLHIASERIKHILPGAFHGLESLRRLYVNKRQVDKIPAPLQYVPPGQTNTILCPLGSSCYVNCISPAQLNYPREYLEDFQPEEFTLRFFEYDLANLEHDIPKWPNLKKVTVYADSLRLESDLTVTYQLVLIARELYVRPGVDFFLPVDPETTLINFYPCGSKKSDVILQTHKVISHNYCPKMPIDPVYAEAMFICIKEHEKMNNKPVSDMTLHEMLTFIADITKHQPQQQRIFDEALQLREVVSTNDRSEIAVPFLSLQSHDNILQLYEDYAKNFDTELDIILAKLNQRELLKSVLNGQTSVLVHLREGELRALERSKKETQGLIQIADNAVKEASTRWKASANAVQGFFEKFKEANATLTRSKFEFEGGIKQHFTEEIAVGVVNVLGAIGSVFFGGFDISGIQEAAQSAAKLKRLARILQRLSKIAQVAIRLTEIMGQAYPLVQLTVDASDRIWDLGGLNVEDWTASDPSNRTTAVDVFQWDELTIAADAYLGVGIIATVFGSEEYRIALSKTALWGKAHTSAILETRNLFQNLAMEVNRRKFHKNELEHIDKAIQETKKGIEDLKQGKHIDKAQAKKEVTAIFDNLGIVKLQRFNVMTTINSALSSFCQAYYYTYLEECGSLFAPHFGSDLKVLVTKIQEARKRAVLNKGKFSPYTPSRFTKTKILQNEVQSNCTLYSKCPITFLKTDNVVIFDIPTKDPRFLGSERVRVDEIQVYVRGAKTDSGDLSVWIENVGKLKDRYNGKDYYFSSVPLSKRFKYNVNTGKIETHANINTDDRSYTATTPFTIWTLAVTQRENPGLDLRNVERVEIVFKGTSIEKKISPDKRSMIREIFKY